MNRPSVETQMMNPYSLTFNLSHPNLSLETLHLYQISTCEVNQQVLTYLSSAAAHQATAARRVGLSSTEGCPCSFCLNSGFS